MTPERWQQVRHIFDDALERPPDERPRFLDQACANDAELRREVEAMLVTYADSDGFLSQPAIAHVAETVVEAGQLTAGQCIGPYEIVKPLGAGGMGEVYLAQDTRLNRPVALKMLPANTTADAQANKRLTREARAAAALDHPNICAIYDVGEADGRGYIAMQYMAGETLSARLKREPPALSETLDITARIAEALVEAHAQGVTHRDIKPLNVMLTARGGVKVLDFGLAKKESGPQELTDTATQSLISAPGMVLGTVPYMSPEQLRGQEVDGRSDLWSLGVVLYEIVAGRKPFAGATTNDTIAAILQNEPAPLDNAPLQLRRIVSRALAKQLDERYPTANEMLLDLQNLRRDLDSGAVFANSVAPDAEVEHETRRLPAATGNLDGADTSRSMSSAEYLVTEIQRHRRGALAALLALLLVGAALGYYFTRPAPANVAQETAALDSLAVLPFANAAQDPSAEYLSDGITGSLINSLSQLPGLKVMSLSAVFRYKGQATDALKVGQELNVRAVLQGSVKQIGDQLAINVELVDTLDNHQIWGEQYVRKFADVLTVQSEIAQEVSSKLRLKLTSAQQQQLTKRDTDNAEAYREYLKGRFYTLQYTPEGHKKALEHLNKAIAIDPTYALAYAGVADAYTTISDSFLSPREALSKAKAAAQKALDLDDKIAEAWAARGHARLHEWDPAALDDLRKALELAPNSLTNQLWLGEYYMIWDVGKSVEVLEKAAELDPLSAIPPAFLSFDYYMLRQPEKAIENGKKAIELNPGFYTENAYLARIYASRGDLKSALETINKVPPEALNGMAVSTKGYLFAVQGKRREAEQTIAEMQKMSATQYVSPFEFAIVYMALNNRDPTFFYLNKAYEDRSENLGFIRTMPLFDSVRDDPRYADLLRRIGLPQ